MVLSDVIRNPAEFHQDNSQYNLEETIKAFVGKPWNNI